MTHAMHDFLISLGCRQHRSSPTDYILDEIDCEFYLRFDCADDTDRPDVSVKTCDIHIVPLRADDWKAESIRLVADCNRQKVLRFLFALGADRFKSQTRQVMYEVSNPLRKSAS